MGKVVMRGMLESWRGDSFRQALPLAGGPELDPEIKFTTYIISQVGGRNL